MVHLHSPISVYFYGTVETLLVDTYLVGFRHLFYNKHL